MAEETEIESTAEQNLAEQGAAERNLTTSANNDHGFTEIVSWMRIIINFIVT